MSERQLWAACGVDLVCGLDLQLQLAGVLRRERLAQPIVELVVALGCGAKQTASTQVSWMESEVMVCA